MYFGMNDKERLDVDVPKVKNGYYALCGIHFRSNKTLSHLPKYPI